MTELEAFERHVAPGEQVTFIELARRMAGIEPNGRPPTLHELDAARRVFRAAEAAQDAEWFVGCRRFKREDDA